MKTLLVVTGLALLWISCSSEIEAEYCPDGVDLGEVCMPADCPNRDCPPGFYCDQNECLELACLDVNCPAGEACAGGSCYPQDCEHRNCPGLGEVCVEEECLPASCLEVECPDGQRCAAGHCYPIDCDTKQCPGYGEVCIDGDCIQRTCVGVECPPGQACVSGYCYPADCQDTGCPDDQVCVDGMCQPNLCVEVICPVDEVCLDGWCFAENCPEEECGPDEICYQDECLPIDCYGIVCPLGQICLQGECLEDPCLTLECDDLNECTEDSCSSGQCRHAALASGSVCDLGLVCSQNDSCQAGICLAGPEPDCDDGLYCTGDETCDEVAGCQSPGDPCLVGGLVCDEETDACLGCLQDLDCDDGLYCTGTGSCAAGVCQSSGDPCPGTDAFCDDVLDECVQCLSASDCDDQNECTMDQCDAGVCDMVPLPDATPCTGSNACTSTFLCQSGVCSPGPSELDFDGDLYIDAACPGGTDCDDQNWDIHPDALEGPPFTPTCEDLADNDCDGDTDLDDLDCWNVAERLVMVTPDGTFANGHDDAKHQLLDDWGWTVVGLAEDATQAEFDLEAWRCAVFLISQSCSTTPLQARELDVGVVIEEVMHFGDFQYAITFGWGGGSGNVYTILDSSHPITAGFADGDLTVFSSNPLIYSYGDPTAPGAEVLAVKPGSGKVIVAIEVGAELLFSNWAAGRRALCAMGRIDPALWNNNSRTLFRQTIEWAAQ